MVLFHLKFIPPITDIETQHNKLNKITAQVAIKTDAMVGVMWRIRNKAVVRMFTSITSYFMYSQVHIGSVDLLDRHNKFSIIRFGKQYRVKQQQTVNPLTKHKLHTHTIDNIVPNG